jgi:hypothetical protein
LLGNFGTKWDARLNCEVSIDGFKGELSDDGGYKVGYSGKALRCRYGAGGKGTIGAGPFTVNIQDGEFTSVSVEGSNWETSVDSSGNVAPTVTVAEASAANYPPFTGAGKLTVTSKVNPSTGRMEPAVGFSGKLGSRSRGAASRATPAAAA